jgi:exosome complex component RRP43
MDASAFRTVHPREFYGRFLARGVRPDGRALLRPRHVSATSSVVGSAAGSAMLKLGRTMVLAGVQLEATPPSEGEPSSGRVVVGLEVAAVASAGDDTSTAGGGGRSEREHAALLELLQGTAATLVPPDALCIAEGKAVWTAYVDLYVLEHDGNLADAAVLALARALGDTRLPRVTVEAEGGALVVAEEAALPLPLGPAPLAVSFGVLDGQLLLDPTREEESLVSTGFTVLVDADAAFAGLHKPGGAPLDDDLLARATQAARERAPQLRAALAAST